MQGAERAGTSALILPLPLPLHPNKTPNPNPCPFSLALALTQLLTPTPPPPLLPPQARDECERRGGARGEDAATFNQLREEARAQLAAAAGRIEALNRDLAAAWGQQGVLAAKMRGAEGARRLASLADRWAGRAARRAIQHWAAAKVPSLFLVGGCVCVGGGLEGLVASGSEWGLHEAGSRAGQRQRAHARSEQRTLDCTDAPLPRRGALTVAAPYCARWPTTVLRSSPNSSAPSAPRPPLSPAR